MQPYKSQKIDPNSDYPCPSCRRGHLLPITLTEAFGCDRCQQLFVVEDNGYVLEQLSTSYPYKRAWRWMGNRWTVAQNRSGLNYSYIITALIIFVLMLITGFQIWKSPSGSNILAQLVVLGIATVALLLITWFNYWR